MFPPIEKANEFIKHFENIRQEIPNEISCVIVIARLVTPGALNKKVLSKYKCIHTYRSGTYLFSRPLDDSPFEKAAIPTTCQYDLYLADEWIADRKGQSLNEKKKLRYSKK